MGGTEYRTVSPCETTSADEVLSAQLRAIETGLRASRVADDGTAPARRFPRFHVFHVPRGWRRAVHADHAHDPLADVRSRRGASARARHARHARQSTLRRARRVDRRAATRVPGTRRIGRVHGLRPWIADVEHGTGIKRNGTPPVAAIGFDLSRGRRGWRVSVAVQAEGLVSRSLGLPGGEARGAQGATAMRVIVPLLGLALLIAAAQDARAADGFTIDEGAPRVG